MKKRFITVVALLVVFGITTIVNAGDYACKKPSIKKETLQDVINQWYVDKEAENFAFTEKMAATVRNMSVDAKDVVDFQAVAMYETILYEHYTDEINCTSDRRRAIKLEEERDIIHSTFGNRARTFLRRLPSVAKDKEGRQSLENFSGCYFKYTEPTLQKMYRQHPSRKTCAK
jgi:hypothetical protein